MSLNHQKLLKNEEQVIGPLRKARQILETELEMAKTKKELKVYSDILKKLKDIDEEIEAFHRLLGLKPREGVSNTHIN